MSDEKPMGQPPEEDRQKQTGMEAKWEVWILDTLNFLMSLDIPAHRRDEFGDKIRGGGLEIPARLNLARQKFAESNRREVEARQDSVDMRRQAKDLQNQVTAADDLLEKLFTLWMRGDDNLESAATMKELEAYIGEKRPHLLEEDNDVADG